MEYVDGLGVNEERGGGFLRRDFGRYGRCSFLLCACIFWPMKSAGVSGLI